MKVVVIGAAKTGYAESITRKLISEGYSVIGTFDDEYADNAKKCSQSMHQKYYLYIR